MPRETERTAINGHDWEVTPWDGMHGVRLQARIARLVGPALGAMGDAGSFLESDVGAVVSALADRIDEKDTPQLIRDLLHGSFVDGKDVTIDRVFNEHFAANYAELYQGLAFILRVNFGDLFQLAAAIGGPGVAASKAKGSPES